jgi:hypothetical protein
LCIACSHSMVFLMFCASNTARGRLTHRQKNYHLCPPPFSLLPLKRTPVIVLDNPTRTPTFSIERSKSTLCVFSYTSSTQVSFLRWMMQSDLSFLPSKNVRTTDLSPPKNHKRALLLGSNSKCKERHRLFLCIPIGIKESASR